jgi:2',3'-cyclic-nucleotide 2'-phosphodiesterase (5'-nucleotidase family)
MVFFPTIFTTLLFIMTTIIFYQRPETINISDYNYPLPQNDKADEYTVAIFGTNDIHGTVFPSQITHPLTKEQYQYGGLSFLATYLKILRSDWGERLIWLDSGDQYQGGIESRLSNGTIILDFFNTLLPNSSVIGNHEFDYGMKFLEDKLEKSNFNYVASNIYNITAKEFGTLPNTNITKLLTVGDIKIGIIGLTTVDTPFTTAPNSTHNLDFASYEDIVIMLSKELRDQGANAVILNTHVGTQCTKDYEEKMTLGIRDRSTKQDGCDDSSEMNQLLQNLSTGTVDAVIGGHYHDVVHHWINGVPISQSMDGGYYSQVMYLTFNTTTKVLIKDSTKIEGPLPTCEKVFKHNQRCDYIAPSDALDEDTLLNFYFHNRLMQKDIILDHIFSKWWEEIKPYKEIIGYTETLLTGDYDNDNVLGNFITDCLINATKADFSIVGSANFRTTWYPGNIMIESVYNMFPFENKLYTIEVTGAEFKRITEIIQKGQNAFYQFGGAKMNLKLNPKGLVEGSLKLIDDSDIEDNEIYTIALSDFLLAGGDDFKDVITWYEIRNLKDHNMMRDHIIECVKENRVIGKEDAFGTSVKRLNVI